MRRELSARRLLESTSADRRVRRSRLRLIAVIGLALVPRDTGASEYFESRTSDLALKHLSLVGAHGAVIGICSIVRIELGKAWESFSRPELELILANTAWEAHHRLGQARTS
jgi:predicted signal transduction protein with EAL and GGDEF domain